MHDASRAQQIKDLFLASLEQPTGERARFIETACADDTLLKNELRSLLNSYREDEDRLETPILDVSAGNLARKALHDPQEAFVGDIGRYRLVREIARGGMGIVYEGARIDGEYEQRVAIKLIGVGQDSEFISRRLREERQILANLNHPNIARLLDGGTTDDGMPYLVMEFVDGLPIDKYADSHGLTTFQRLELFRTICAAVSYAHQNFVIHRDLKPTNILVNQSGVPKLLDFGIAKILGPESSSAASHTTVLFLTPEYSSPEQVRGEAISNATDIYSLGVVLYKLLTGRLPYRFKSKRIDEVARVISTELPEKPSTATDSHGGLTSYENEPSASVSESAASNGSPDKLRRTLRGDLDNILLMALRKEPERRYATVEEFSKDIGRYLSGLPIVARKDTVAYRSTKFFKRNRLLVTTSLVVALVCLVMGSFLTLKTVRAKPVSSVAILPFVNSAGDPNMNYLCEGFTDNLLDELSRMPGLTVPAHNTVFQYAGKPINVQTVTKELGVETVLTGNVATDGGDVLVNVTLSDQNARSIFFRQYRSKASDIQRIQNEIAQDVTNKLGRKLSDERYSKLRGTQSAEAYNLYLKGTYSWNQRTNEGLQKASEYYGRAVEIDPQFALAYCGLANSHSLLGAYLNVSPDESFGKAKPFAQRALQIDPTLPEAHTSMALIRWLYDWDWEGAERHFKAAIELNPNYPLAHHWYGLFLAEMNRPDEAIAEEKRALQLDPLSLPVLSDLARVYYFARRYDDSLSTFRTAKDRLMGARFGDLDVNLLQLYQQVGNIEEVDKMQYPDLEMQTVVRRGGLRAYWLAELRRLQEGFIVTQWKENNWINKAELSARVGDNDTAIDALNRAFETRNHLMTQLKVNPAFDGLRSDPRFIELLRRMHL